MREARIACTVGGTRMSFSGLASLTAPLRISTPCSNNDWTIYSMKKGLPSVGSGAMRRDLARDPLESRSHND